jgi:trimethylamine--corrinoid protein Co-methyltransferase
VQTDLQVLSEAERAQVHVESLELLRTTGVRLESDRGRRLLGEAGAEVAEADLRVRFPRTLVEDCLRAAPTAFSLGGRRPGWALAMNRQECTLGADGTGVHVLDLTTGHWRPGTADDWRSATDLLDALDEIGVYWCMLDPGFEFEREASAIGYWKSVFTHFSKHIQDSTNNPAETRWLLEVLQVVFGSQENVRRFHPFSFLFCPLSPLVLEGPPVDAYLETAGWEIPIAVMPMPLMGATAPASLISTLVLANVEVLASLCLVQSAMPGAPFLYAAAPALVNPRTWRFGGGEVEHALLGAAVTEMARFYGLPAECSTGGTDQPAIGIQAGYERALNWSLPALSWPDILIGPGLLAGSMVLSLEQLLIDVEVFRRCVRLHRGIESTPAHWLEAAVESGGPGANFLRDRTTRNALHAGEWHMADLGIHRGYERWLSDGQPGLLDLAGERVAQILAGHAPLPLQEEVRRELERIETRARQAHANNG